LVKWWVWSDAGDEVGIFEHKAEIVLEKRAVRKKIDRINAYFPMLAGQAFVDLWRGPRRYSTFLLDDKRWKSLVAAMNIVGGEWFIAAPQNHCKVVWRRG
jgi:hypothetical protein